MRERIILFVILTHRLDSLPLFILQLHVVTNAADQIILGARHIRKQHSAASNHLKSLLTQLRHRVAALDRLPIVGNECLERRFAHLAHDLTRGGSNRREEKIAHLQVLNREEHDRRVLLDEELVLLQPVDREHQEPREPRDAVRLLDVVPDLLGQRHAVVLAQQRVQRYLRLTPARRRHLAHHTLLVLVLEQRHGRQVQRQHQVVGTPRRRLHLCLTPTPTAHRVLALLPRHARLHLLVRALLRLWLTPRGGRHLRVLRGGDLDLALEARLHHRRLYISLPAPAPTVLLVLQPGVQRVHKPSQELRSVAACLDSETLLAGPRDLVHELGVREWI